MMITNPPKFFDFYKNVKQMVNEGVANSKAHIGLFTMSKNALA